MDGIGIRAALADNGNRKSVFGCRSGTPGFAHANSQGGFIQMKDDAEDIPMVYLLYVLLAIAAVVVAAAVLVIRLI